MPPPLHLCSCPVHVRPAHRRRPNQSPRSAPGSAGHRRRRTQPHRAPPRPRPHADRLRQATRHHAATAHRRHQPRRHHAALRHHRHRGNPRAHRPRPASRRRARNQTVQPPRPPAGRTSRSERPIPSPAARRPTRGPKAPEQPTPILARLPTPEDIAAQVRRRPVGAVIADIFRDFGIVPSNPLWRELSLAIIENGGNLATLFKDTFEADQRVADRSAHGRASCNTGTRPAIRGDARHRAALNRQPRPSRRHARACPGEGRGPAHGWSRRPDSVTGKEPS